MYVEKSNNAIKYDRNKLEIVYLDQLVPEDHLVKKIENVVDFEFIHDLTKEYYSPDFGRPCLDTIILFKIVLLNYLFGKNSIRLTIEETKVNMAFRWFLGISISDPVPNFSTFSQNYRRRYADTDVFEKIFSKIIQLLLNYNLIDTSVIFIDGTHIKANANKKKYEKKQIKIVSDQYQKKVELEIDEYREYSGRSRYFDDDSNNDGTKTIINDETGEVIEQESDKTKTITKSITDPDCGMFVKGEHERQFAYVDQVACDSHGWVLGFDVNPGNMHDSKAFLPFFYNTLLPYNPEVICADAGYANGLLGRFVQEENIHLLTPYVSPRGIKTEYGKSKFTYIDDIDEYLCPNLKTLVPWNIDKLGNVQYKIHSSECGTCPLRSKCIKNNAFKSIIRNIYEDCKMLMRDYRLSPQGKEIYKKRKETIERVFAEGKERHGLRVTRFIGKKKNRDFRSLLYACLNIKKLALLLNQ